MVTAVSTVLNAIFPTFSPGETTGELAPPQVREETKKKEDKGSREQDIQPNRKVEGVSKWREIPRRNLSKWKMRTLIIWRDWLVGDFTERLLDKCESN